MAKRNMNEIEAWLAQWPIGSKGRFGGRIKETVTVVAISWCYGFPTIELNATTGHTYYCKYGTRRELEAI